MKTLIFCLLLISPSWLLGKPVMQVSSINDEPHLIMVRQVQQAYATIGFDISITQMPALRAIRQAENDQHFDAVMAREAAAQVLLPHYLQLKVPIQHGQVVAYSKHKELELSDWQSLAPYRLVTVRGILSVSQSLSSHPQLELVNTPYQAMQMLERDRVDLAILPSRFGQYELKQHHYPQIQQIAVLKQFTLYHYLHKKHARLATALEQALEDSFYPRNPNEVSLYSRQAQQ